MRLLNLEPNGRGKGWLQIDPGRHEEQAGCFFKISANMGVAD
jgi:hypothetical protein